MVAGVLGACSSTPEPQAGDALTETRVIKSGVLTVKATIINIDAESKMLTLDSDGKQVVVVVSDIVKNFDQLKVGDIVEADYKASTAVYARVGDGIARINSSEVMEKNETGTPGSEVTETVEIISNITALDKEKRIITLLEPSGEEVITPIQDDSVDLSNINIGDQVVVIHTRAIAVSLRSTVEPTATAEPAEVEPTTMPAAESEASAEETKI